MANSTNRRKKIRRALAVLAWLLLLGGVSYFLFLPDLDEASQQLKAIREDPSLTFQEKIAKSREIYSKLTSQQGQQVFQNDMKKLHYERNREMQKFLKMTPEEQVAYLKQKAEEQKKSGKDTFVGVIKGGPVKVGPSGPGGGGPGVFGMGARVADGGGGHIFVGPAGGGGPRNPEQMQKNMLDNFSPETRAGQSYQRGLLSK